MPDEDKHLKGKPLSATALARAEVLTLIRERYLGSTRPDAIPRGLDDRPMHGPEQMPVTIPHVLIGQLYRLPPFQSRYGDTDDLRQRPRVVDFDSGADWEGLRTLRSDLGCQGCVSREYPGAWVKSIVQALEGAQE